MTVNEIEAQLLLRRRNPALELNVQASPPAARLLSKKKVLGITGLSYPTIWAWMRDGRFPRSRIVGGKSMWLSTEIDAWVAGLPVRP
jgi:prophage regulatory protein